MRSAAIALLTSLAALSGCPLGRPADGSGTERANDDALRIVVAERAPSGGSRLVIVAENGDRITDLAIESDNATLDINPAFSPDGNWVVFASSRGGKIDESFSLWIVPARQKATPVRLTEGPSDVTPTWTPDGKAIVYASNRAGTLDLWRLEVRVEGGRVVAAGAPTQLTSLPGRELSPAIAADGRIAFTSETVHKGVKQYRIAVRSPDGKIKDVTRGPGDTGPGWTHDGKSIVFTAPHLRPVEGGSPLVDGDLYAVPSKGGDVTLMVDLPGTDETGPVFSADGRWLFATSMLRSLKDQRPLMSSVVHVDRWEKVPVARMLVDHVGPVARLAVAVAPGVLDASALHEAPDYQKELKAILERALNEAAAASPAATPPAAAAKTTPAPTGAKKP